MTGRPWGATIVGDVVYVTDTTAHEVVAFDRTSYARLGAFGTKGCLPGQMIGTSGIDHDAAGNLYVVDQDGGPRAAVRMERRAGAGDGEADGDIRARARRRPRSGSRGDGRRRHQGAAGRGPGPGPDDRQVLERA